LGTVMKDGRPQVSFIWINIEDYSNIILVTTSQGRIKHKNVLRDPRVCLSPVDRNNLLVWYQFKELLLNRQQ
jgi:Pyridoxamine 5'-phosphate oxidase